MIMTSPSDPLVNTLSESLIDEMVAAVGLPTTKTFHNIFWLLFRKITDRLAYLGVTFDQIVGEDGLPAASSWALTHFCNEPITHNADNIPEGGPLLALSSHPGAYDALVLYSNLKGHDIRSVSTVIPFFKHLPNTSRIFLFAPRNDARERMLVMRNAIKHLQQGGTVIYFGAGHREPDPVVYPGAEQSIDSWLDVFDIFFKYVKDLKIMPTITSGVVSSRWAKHPITWLRRKQIDKQRLSEFGQVITQLIKPGKLMMTPRISFGETFTEEELRQKAGPGNLYDAVINRAKDLFQESGNHFGDFIMIDNLKE